MKLAKNQVAGFKIKDRLCLAQIFSFYMLHNNNKISSKPTT